MYYFLLFYLVLLTNEFCVRQVSSQFSRNPGFDRDNPFRFRGSVDKQSQRKSAPPPPKKVDPCQPNVHRIIKNEPQRSYNYRLGTGSRREKVLCDRDLQRGWYRFSSVAGDTIPTTCPGVDYCGTRAPVWMEGNLPSVKDGITKVHGCISVQGECCSTKIPILVKNCTSFIVYHLEPTPACPSAYCAGYEVPCPVGLSSETGYTPCHFPVDLLETHISHGISRDLKHVEFYCDVTLGGHVVPDSVALEVEWLADDEIIQTETFPLTEQHKGVLHEKKWNIGQALQCRARAKHKSINTFTALVTSPPFETGFQLSNPITMMLTEGGDAGFIEFRLKVPIICPPKKKKKKKGKTNSNNRNNFRNENPRSKRKDDNGNYSYSSSTKDGKEVNEDEEGCCVSLEIIAHSNNPTHCPDGNPVDMILLSSCTHKVCEDEWNATQIIPVWAGTDGLIGAEHENEEPTVILDVKVADTSPKRWLEVPFPSHEIYILPGDVEERCAIEEEATVTFDGFKYVNRIEGIFILYKHETLPYEVQIQLRKCKTNKRTCICGVAIRFGQVMLAFESCKTGKTRIWSYSLEYVEPSKIYHLPQILRIDEGRTFQIQYPSGTRVSIGQNLQFVQIQGSLRDLEQTVGLCGSFDRDRTNDLNTYRQRECKVLNNSKITSCDEFTKSWRLLPEQSLFQGVFSNDPPILEEIGSNPGHCSCSDTYNFVKKVELRPKPKSKYSSYPYEEYSEGGEDGSQTEDSDGTKKCYRFTCGDSRGVDVTTQLLNLLSEDDFILDEDENFGRDSSNVVINPLFSYANNKKEKNPVNWKEEDAEVYCLKTIEGSKTAKLCRDEAFINVDGYTSSCKNEILETKDGSWAIDTLEQLRWECRDQIFHNIHLWEPQLGRRYGTPPLSLLSSLCLNNCSNSGSTCENGVCNCERGYGGADCSVDTNHGPLITELNHNGICDIRTKPCSELLVWGDRFADHSSIKCHFEIYRTVNVKSIPVLSGSITTEGKLLTFQSIICDVPELPIHDAKISSFYIPGEGIDKTRTFTRLSLSYGVKGVRSKNLDYTLYDSLCWNCEAALNCHPSPTQSCNVLTEPFGSSGSLTDIFGGGLSSFGDPSISPTISLLQPTNSNKFEGHIHPHYTGPCHFQKDPGPCRGEIIRYYFDARSKLCKPFIFGGCQGNSNNFQSEKRCISECITKEDEDGKASYSIEKKEDGNAGRNSKCGRLHVDDDCLEGDVVNYYFDEEKRKCRPFIACSLRNFPNRRTCEEECKTF